MANEDVTQHFLTMPIVMLFLMLMMLQMRQTTFACVTTCGLICQLMPPCIKTTIRDGGCTALYAAFTVDTACIADTVYTVDTVDTVYTVDMVCTFDTVGTGYNVYTITLLKQKHVCLYILLGKVRQNAIGRGG